MPRENVAACMRLNLGTARGRRVISLFIGFKAYLLIQIPSDRVSVIDGRRLVVLCAASV